LLAIDDDSGGSSTIGCTVDCSSGGSIDGSSGGSILRAVYVIRDVDAASAAVIATSASRPCGESRSNEGMYVRVHVSTHVGVHVSGCTADGAWRIFERHCCRRRICRQKWLTLELR
jgi:hypothetical protein